MSVIPTLSEIEINPVISEIEVTPVNTINVTNNVIQEAVWGEITGDISNQEDLTLLLNEKADLTNIATVGLSGDYNDLLNKPSIPTKTSDLSNDSGYLTTETDPVFSAWDKDYDDLTNKPVFKTVNNESIIGEGNIQINGVTDHTLLTNIGTNSHADIDTALQRLVNTSGTNTGDQDLSGYQLALDYTPENADNKATDLTDPDNILYPTTLAVSNAISGAIATKQDALVSGTNIKTINGNSLLGSGDLHSHLFHVVSVSNAAYNVSTNDEFIVINHVLNDVNIHLPDATVSAGRILYVTNPSISAGFLTTFINAYSGQQINGSSSYSLTGLDVSVLIYCNGNNWRVILEGKNTGDETQSTIKSKLESASTNTDGYLTSTDWNTFNNKQNSLGFTPFNVFGDTLTGTAGAGFVGFNSQSTKPSTPVSGFKIYADNSNKFSWIGQNGYIRTFDGTSNTADRSYTLPDKSGTIALTSDVPTVSISNGQIAYGTGTNSIGGSNNFTWDSTNRILSLTGNSSQIALDNTIDGFTFSSTDDGYSSFLDFKPKGASISPFQIIYAPSEDSTSLFAYANYIAFSSYGYYSGAGTITSFYTEKFYFVGMEGYFLADFGQVGSVGAAFTKSGDGANKQVRLSTIRTSIPGSQPALEFVGSGISFWTRSNSPSSLVGVKNALQMSTAGLIGINQSTPTAQLHIANSSASQVGFLLVGASNQSVDILQVQNNSNIVKLLVTKDYELKTTRRRITNTYTTNTTLTVDNDYVVGNGTSITIILPSATTLNEHEFTIKNINSTELTINATSVQTIDGKTSISLAQYQVVTVVARNDNWDILLLEYPSTFDDLLPTSFIQTSGGAAPNVTLVGSSLILKAQEFPNSSAVEEYEPIWQLPHSWKEGSTIYPHIHLYIPDDVTGGDLTFNMTYCWTNVNSNDVTESTVSGTITRAANAGIAGNAILSFGAIAGTGKTLSNIFRARITRSQTDTFAGTCWILSCDIHIEKNKLGTATLP